MSSSTTVHSQASRIAMHELGNMISVPMSLTAIVRLGVPDAVWQSGANTPLTAAAIASLISAPPSAAANLQCLLRLLASHHVFTEHKAPNLPTPSYSLTEIGQTLVSGECSYAPYILQRHQKALIHAWPLLHETVTDPEGPEPFKKVNGVSPYELSVRDKEEKSLMQKSMWGVSKPVMETLLEGYGGFEGVRRLVDVGGSSGACLAMIMKRVVGVVEGVNFDLPDVVAGAPAFPGVTHVGGDMFKSIPNGDAIFMKSVLVAFTDEECITVLKNCYNALPEGGGKLISCEPVEPEEVDDSCRTRFLLASDVFIMTHYSAPSSVRTAEDYKQLGLSVGFHNFKAIYVDLYFTVLEFTK